MDVRIEPTESAVGQLAADFVEAALTNPDPTIGLATGATPLGTYNELIRRYRGDGLRFDHAHYVLLDEYVGIPSDHPASFRSDIHRDFTDHVGIPRSNVHAPPGDAANLQDAGDQYESLLAGLPPRQIQILGIGRDGHIGFNEPTSSLASRTRVKTLLPETRADNQRHFPPGDTVPHRALTMGIGTILEAHQLLLLALGQAKSDAVAAALEGPVTAVVPASALQLHPSVTVILDEAAASDLAFYDYYRETASSRPEWQRP